MNYINRLIDLQSILQKRSVFLLGPRQTGKSTYIREQLKGMIALSVNLLDRAQYRDLVVDPTRLRQRIEAQDLKNCVVVVDEVQKCPELLDEIHLMIEERKIRFLLTGSSARKLRRGGVNLLGGRGWDRVFHPFVYMELKKHNFSLERSMYSGTLPNHYFSEDPDEDLQSYIGRYLTEEIAAEGVSRNIPAFGHFLEVAASANAQLVNYTSLASDAQMSRQTIYNYFQVLKDTLVAFELPGFTNTKYRKAIEKHKVYFFDMGVVRALRRLHSISEASSEYGLFFEHFIFLEIKTYLDYIKPTKSSSFHYWRSASGFEVDFIINENIAVEVKSSTHIDDKHLKGLRALIDENLMLKKIVVSREKYKRKFGEIVIYPWEEFLEELWAGSIV